MAKRARLLSAAAGPVLPDELVWEILARLPARGLLRCHAVCRDWRRLATSADFLLAHHRHQPPRPLVFGCARWRSGAAADADAAVDSVDLIRHPPSAAASSASATTANTRASRSTPPSTGSSSSSPAAPSTSATRPRAR
uniref:F-box domain-containing protein n=1 Tax=Oryza glaberrima TaxID=4538 RepID=I1PJB2_ORYGL